MWDNLLWENNKTVMTRIISFSGIDGCGKTTVIKCVRKELESRGHKTNCVWLRYNHYLTKILHAFCRLTGLTRYEWHDGIRVGYHEFYRSTIISNLSIILNFIDTFFATFFLVYIPVLFTKRIIICDRWVFDILIDLQVDTGKYLGPDSFWGRMFLKLVPGNAKCFLIFRDASMIEATRPEHAHDKNYKPRRELFSWWSAQPKCVAIDNNGSVQDTVRLVLARLNI